MNRHHLYLIAGCLALALFLAFGWQTALGAPPNPQIIPLSQPDGAAFQARLWGDEWANGMETTDGYSILRNAQNVWMYAVAGPDGNLVPGTLVVGKDKPTVKPHLRPTRTSQPAMPRMPVNAPENAAQVSGTQKVLILLAQFANQSAIQTKPAYWRNLFFGSTGNTVKSFYSTASYGTFGIEPAAENYGTANDGVVGWLTLPYNHPNTGTTPGDVNRQLTRDLIVAADPYVNYAAFDTNGDGYVSANELHIVVVVAGYDSSYGGSQSCGPSIMSHHSALSDPVDAPVVDGKTVGDAAHGGGYMQVGEWHCANWAGGSPGYAATMGPVTHEFGHDLNLPDLYDTDGSSWGVGVWSVMGTGSWNTVPTGKSGDTPALPDVWSKYYLGWVKPTEVTRPIVGASISQAETYPVAFRLGRNPYGVDWQYGVRSGSGDYFLVENRQRIGFDAGLPGGGLLIWHVNEAVASSSDANHDENFPLLGLEQADGARHLNTKTNAGDAGDPYPGTSSNYFFNNSSTPNSKLYNGNSSGVAVEAISASGPIMTADLKAPVVPDNDNIGAARVIGSLPAIEMMDPFGAVAIAADPVFPCASHTRGQKTVWYRYTPSSAGVLSVDTFGSNYDTMLAVWIGTPGALTPVACNDDWQSLQSAIRTIVTPGQSYYIEVAQYGGGSPPGSGPVERGDKAKPQAPQALPFYTLQLNVSMSTNLLKNPSFENDANADTRPDAWSIDPAFTRAAGKKLVGAYSGRFYSTADITATVSQNRTVVPNATYYVGGWVNAHDVAAGDLFALRLKVRWLTAANSLIREDTVGSVTGAYDEWRPLQSTLVAPATAAQAQIVVTAESVDGKIFIDNFWFAR